MKYYITHDLTGKQKSKIKEKGIFTYDLRLDDFCNDIATIERRVWVNKFGSMITNEEISLGNDYNNNFVDYNEFIKKNERIDYIEDLFDKKFTNEEIILFSKEALLESTFSDCEIEYVIKNRDEANNTFVIATNRDITVGFNPFENEFYNYQDWAFDLDEDLFRELEWNKEIIYMTKNCHCGIWLELSKYYPEEFTYVEGVHEYLKYCKENNITIDKILEITNDPSLKNVMKFLPDIIECYEKNDYKKEDRRIDLWR